MILIDNYDSFTYNIVQYLRELGVKPKVFKNNEISPKELKNIEFSSIIISPGPGNPNNAGNSMKVIAEFYNTKKILGICLGHQCIAQYFGANVIKAKEPCHGKTSKILFEENELFLGVPQGFVATRYHSLIVDNKSLTNCIKPLAYTKDNVLMALKHKDYPIYGVQFHPEAIMTKYGKLLLSNFIYI